MKGSYYLILLYCLSLVMICNCKMQSIILTKINISPTPSKPQLQTGNKSPLEDYCNVQYTGTIRVGTPGQLQQVIFDTGSDSLWLASNTCINCGKWYPKFKPNSSTSFTNLTQNYTIQYQKGNVTGLLSKDFVSFQSLNISLTFMTALNSTGIENVVAGGVMGLSNRISSKNIFDIGFSNGVLVSSSYAFKLGINQFSSPSFFYYNLTAQDFPNAKYVNTLRNDMWVVSLSGLYVNNQKFEISQALIDSGSSFSHIPQSKYSQIYQLYFSKFCNSSNSINICICTPQLYPNLTLPLNNNISILFTPSMYIFGSGYSQQCYLGLTPTNKQRIVLSQNFLQFNTIIFDKQNKRIGFIQTINSISQDFINISQHWIITFFKLLSFMLLLCLIIIMCNTFKKSQVQVQTEIPIIQLKQNKLQTLE